MISQKLDWQHGTIALRSLVTGWLLSGLLVSLVFAGISSGTESTTPEALSSAIERLEADSYVERERALHELWRAGKPAEPYLERALGHASIDVRSRARRALQLLRFGLYADASREHWDFIREFHSSDLQHQSTVLVKMLNDGEADLALRLLDGAGSSRKFLLGQLSGELEKVLPGIILAGDFDQVQRIVELLASEGRRLRYAAWFHHLRGTKDDAAARLSALTSPDTNIRRRLYYLAVAREDTDMASKLADELNLIGEERTFGLGALTPAAFAKQSADATKDQVEKLGFLAAHARLTGDTKKFSANIAGLQRIARLSRKELPFCIEAMIINGDLNATLKASATAMVPFRIHARQWKIDSALRSLGITAQAPPFSPWVENMCTRIEFTPTLNSRRLKTREELLDYLYALADLCIQTGETAEAERVCRLAADSLMKADRLGFQQAIRHESKLGLKELAMHHAQQALAIGTPEISVFLGLYGKNNQHARNWFDFLRNHEESKHADAEHRLQILDLLLAPTKPESEQRAMATKLINHAFSAENPLRGARKSTWETTLAYTASLHGVPLPPGFELAASEKEKAAPGGGQGERKRLPTGTRILNRPHSVLSPYGIDWVVDVKGKRPGEKVRCPFSGKDFIVPPYLASGVALLPRSDDNIRALRATGEAHLAAQRYGEAARAFGAAVKAADKHAAPELVYLHGSALKLAGDIEAGTLRHLQARLLAPLTADRLGFISFLWDQNELETVTEECRFLHLEDRPRIAGADGRMFEVVARFLEDTDPLRAADLLEMKLLTGLRKQEGSRLTDYLEARFMVHFSRARGLQKLGDLANSLEEIRQAAKMLPADARLAEALAPLLKSASLREEAGKLLATIDAAAEKAATQFQDSAMLRTNRDRVKAVLP